MTVAELRAKHPFPWRYLSGPGGNIIVSDASGVEVPLFALLDFVCAITKSIESQKEASAT